MSILKVSRVVVAALVLAAPIASAQQSPYGGYWFGYPYDGSNPPYPLDPARLAVGLTPAEACAQRTDKEILGDFSAGPVIFIGLLPDGRCGYKWINPLSQTVITTPLVTPQFATCEQFGFFNPAVPKPGLCPLDCPADQKDPNTGLCRISLPKTAGKSCPSCGNPVNPGTAGKYQEETDLPPAGGQLALVRYYNHGRPAFDKVMGGFWQHTYNRKILIGAPATQALAYRNDGKQLSFTLQGASWAGEADVADRLIELQNAQGVRTGWQYRVAATDDTEHYDASGNLAAIQSRSGLTCAANHQLRGCLT